MSTTLAPIRYIVVRFLCTYPDGVEREYQQRCWVRGERTDAESAQREAIENVRAGVERAGNRFALLSTTVYRRAQ